MDIKNTLAGLKNESPSPYSCLSTKKFPATRKLNQKSHWTTIAYYRIQKEATIVCGNQRTRHYLPMCPLNAAIAIQRRCFDLPKASSSHSLLCFLLWCWLRKTNAPKPKRDPECGVSRSTSVVRRFYQRLPNTKPPNCRNKPPNFANTQPTADDVLHAAFLYVITAPFFFFLLRFVFLFFLAKWPSHLCLQYYFAVLFDYLLFIWK